MVSCRKSAGYFRHGAGVLPVAALVFFAVFLLFLTHAAASDRLTVRTGEHENYSRVVFDWGRGVDYRAERSGNVLDIVFQAETRQNIPETQFRAASLRGLEAGRHIPSPPERAGITHIRLLLPDAVRHRDYLIGDRIVFDFYSEEPMRPQPAVRRAEAPQPQAVPERRPHTETAEAAPVAVEPDLETESTEADEPEKKPETQEPENALAEGEAEIAEEEIVTEPAFTASVSGAPDAEAVPPVAVEREALSPQYTTMTLTTIEPSSLAVFERFGDLWLVLDREAGSVPPQIAGPLRGQMGRGEEVVLPRGTAYRFRMPEGAEVSEVNYESMVWIVSLRMRHLEDGGGMQSGNLRRVVRAGHRPHAEIFMPGVARILQMRLPSSGETLYVATADRPAEISISARYPQFAVLPAYQGAVVKPYDDDVTVQRRSSYIEITRQPGRLVMTEDIAELPVTEFDAAADEREAGRLYDFYSWRRGGIGFLHENQRLIEGKLLHADTDEEAAAVYLEMALLYFANGFGHEAVAALRAALRKNPALENHAGFLAVRGGAKALAGFYREAILDLSAAGLDAHPEARMWRGYAAAASEQWRLAGELFPRNNEIVLRYPPRFSVPFMLYMAESALRLGDTVRARNLINALETLADHMQPHHAAAMRYLRGEAYRQEGEPARALQTWFGVAGGRDRLFHVKASLSIVQLLREIGRISADDARDRLETLRYGWRGDGLEIQVLNAIARLHMDEGRYVQGLREMRRAVILSEEFLHDSAPLIAGMAEIFRRLYVDGEARKLPAFEAVAVFNSFKELMPAGEDSVLAERNYAEFLVEIDLLKEAAEIFEKQMAEHLDDPQEIAEMGAKLAAIYLRDSKPREALSAIQRSGRENLPQDLIDRRNLLRARALSELGMTEEAVSLLSGIRSAGAQQLMADIHWQKRDWPQAAAVLQALLPAPDVLGSDQKRAEDSALVLNAAVAYKMADDSAALARLRSRYLDAMRATPEGAAFAVVTRPSTGQVTLQDRQTILDMAAEVDIFGSFLKNYRMEDRNN